MCARDPLFWVNTFVWTLDPLRHPDAPDRPLITYPHQDPAILRVMDAIGYYDVVCEKSRDEGATWCLLIIPFVWRWLFRDGQSFLLVSRNFDYVDCKGNPKALFSKIDYLLDRLPSWMLAGYNEKKHRKKGHIQHPYNGSVIDGESTTGDLAAGDRRTAAGVDEYARFPIDDANKALGALTSVTRCRIYNSTHQGTNTAFAKVIKMAREEGVGEVVQLPWWKNPTKNPGLYTARHGRLKILDETYDFQPDYKFNLTDTHGAPLDGKPRSPWYDYESKRLIYPSLVATELDMSPGESVARWYDQALVNRLIDDAVREPFHVGELEYGRTTIQPDGFVADKDGPLKLWLEPDAHGDLPRDRRYVCGCDIAAGTGASNSAAVMFDGKTGEQVAELVTPRARPDVFADMVVALCRWFGNAFLVWEGNGHGLAFGDRVIEAGYHNVYFSQDEGSIKATVSMRPGWWAAPGTKKKVFGAHRRALEDGECIMRSVEAARELEHFIFLPTGVIAHDGSVARMDPSGARDNHGDRVTAHVMAWRGMKERASTNAGASRAPRRAPPGSLAERREEAEAEKRKEEAWA